MQRDGRRSREASWKKRKRKEGKRSVRVSPTSGHLPVIPELERSEIRHGGRFAKDRERMLARGANVVVLEVELLDGKLADHDSGRQVLRAHVADLVVPKAERRHGRPAHAGPWAFAGYLANFSQQVAGGSGEATPVWPAGAVPGDEAPPPEYFLTFAGDPLALVLLRAEWAWDSEAYVV